MNALAKPRRRKCKVKTCDNWFQPFNSLEQWCSADCGFVLAQEKLEKKRKKEELAERRDKRARKRDRIKTKKAFNENDKKYVEKRAKAYLHRWIRWRDLVRDGKTVCMACQKPMNHLPSRAIHAMHFRPSGQNSAIRYHEDNLAIGCYSCNSARGGNLIEYEINLVNEIGRERVEWLKTQNQVHTWGIDELKAIRDDYAARLKALDIPLPSIK